MERRGHVRDELVGVAVARDDQRTSAAGLLLGHRGGEQVVGLVRDDLGGCEAERLGHLRHAVELLAEIVGERIALSLVARKQLVAVRRHASVEADDHGSRLRRAPRREQEIRESDEQADRPAAGALDVRHGVICAVSERVPVDDQQRRHSGDRSGGSPYPPFRN